jgi:hypothetical protein
MIIGMIAAGIVGKKRMFLVDWQVLESIWAAIGL